MLRGRFEIAAGSRGMSRPWRRSKIVRVVRFVIKALDYLRELNILSLALRLLLAMLLPILTAHSIMRDELQEPLP